MNNQISIDYTTHAKSNDLYNTIFLKSIQEAVVAHSDINYTPLIVELKPPYPQTIRVYFYKLLANKEYGYKSILRVPKQKSGERGRFDYSDVNFTMIGGYNPDEDIFVFWDAYLHDGFGFNKNIQVKQEGVIDAIIYGYTSTERSLSSGIIEKITIVKSENLLKGIEIHYKKYLDKLLGV